METICCPETSVETQRTTRRHIPEDYTLHNHRCENLKSYNNIGLDKDFEMGAMAHYKELSLDSPEDNEGTPCNTCHGSW
jgi:hypothetical protein